MKAYEESGLDFLKCKIQIQHTNINGISGLNNRNIQNEQLIDQYWTAKAQDYPKMSLVMLSLNKTCPSSAEIERQFSKITNILTQKRARLDDSRLLKILQTSAVERLEKFVN